MIEFILGVATGIFVPAVIDLFIHRKFFMKWHRMSKISRTLTMVYVTVILFTITMIVCYFVKGGVPDSLIAAVFAATVGETSVCGWIKTSNIKSGTPTEEGNV